MARYGWSHGYGPQQPTHGYGPQQYPRQWHGPYDDSMTGTMDFVPNVHPHHMLQNAHVYQKYNPYRALPGVPYEQPSNYNLGNRSWSGTQARQVNYPPSHGHNTYLSSAPGKPEMVPPPWQVGGPGINIFGSQKSRDESGTSHLAGKEKPLEPNQPSFLSNTCIGVNQEVIIFKKRQQIYQQIAEDELEEVVGKLYAQFNCSKDKKAKGSPKSNSRAANSRATKGKGGSSNKKATKAAPSLVKKAAPVSKTGTSKEKELQSENVPNVNFQWYTGRQPVKIKQENLNTSMGKYNNAPMDQNHCPFNGHLTTADHRCLRGCDCRGSPSTTYYGEDAEEETVVNNQSSEVFDGPFYPDGEHDDSQLQVVDDYPLQIVEEVSQMQVLTPLRRSLLERFKNASRAPSPIELE